MNYTERSALYSVLNLAIENKITENPSHTHACMHSKFIGVEERLIDIPSQFGAKDNFH